MEDFTELLGSTAGERKLLFCEGTDSDEVGRFEDLDDALEVLKAYFFDRGHGVFWKLVRGEVGSGFFHPDEGAKIGDEVIFEKIVGSAVKVFKESPESTARDFRAFTVESGDGTFFVFGVGLANRAGNADPIADMRDFPEGDAGLGHAVGAGVHTEEEHLFFAATALLEVVAMSFPSIFQRVVSGVNRLGKSESPK